MKDESGFVSGRVLRSLLSTAAVLILSAAAFAQARASITIAPPDLPTYQQPVCTNADICPLDGYLWTPGYWAWDGDYYWVPATWMMAPEIGDLWTPGYWSWSDGGYVFHEGYWGQSVGFYGGINYGFGYSGHGYDGARWANGQLYYNTAVNSVSGRFLEKSVPPAVKQADPSLNGWTYTRPVKDSGSRVSYNGDNGGTNARATPEEETAASDKRSGLSLQQTQNAWFAHNDRHEHFSENHGAPPILATPLPQTAIHPNLLPPVERFAIHTGNAELDQKYQKEQDELVAKQEQERNILGEQQKADYEHFVKERRAEKYDPWEMEHVRPDHARETQDLYRKQRQEMLDLERRQQPELAGQLQTAN